MQGVNQYKFML